MRILAVDPGEKKHGLAISDPGQNLARPLDVIPAGSRDEDAMLILQIAEKEEAVKIIIGQALLEDGRPNYSGRKAARLAGALRSRTEVPVELWDETGSTQKANQIRREMGVGQRTRKTPDDALAAAVILQDYLDHRSIDGVKP
jgi:putative Holliday junction resolvase